MLTLPKPEVLTAPPTPVRPGYEERQSSRFYHIGVIFLSWLDAHGRNYVMGKCVDISEGGVGVELARRIAIGTEVRVHAGFIDLDTAATVRHVKEQASAFSLGLQFKQPLRSDIVARLAAPQPA